MKIRQSETATEFATSFTGSMPHALLLTGPVGVGLYTFADSLVTKAGKPLATIQPEKKTSTSLPIISTERIRQLYIETRSVLNGAHFVIIDDADTMNHTAQNALLKLLEEPNDSVHFILTSHAPDRLLTTIKSRVQQFAVPPLSNIESRRLIKSLGVTDETDEKRLLYIADGLPAELTRLIMQKLDFEALMKRVKLAREFIEGTSYQRLAMIQSFKDDRQTAIQLIEMVLLLLKRTISSSTDSESLKLIDTLINASNAIRANGNIKLQLSSVVV